MAATLIYLEHNILHDLFFHLTAKQARKFI